MNYLKKIFVDLVKVITIQPLRTVCRYLEESVGYNKAAEQCKKREGKLAWATSEANLEDIHDYV